MKPYRYYREVLTVELLIIGLIVWLVAPIPLGILYGIARARQKQREKMLLHLYMQRRISEKELTLAGVPLPPAVSYHPNAPAPAASDNPEQSLADAAARAARIAEAELSGQPEPIPVPEPATEIQSEPIPIPEPAAEVHPELIPTSEPAAPLPIQPNVPVPQRNMFHISAITVMLSVGVLLIITAGLIFVRTAWSSLSDFGRLTTLAAGSVLFFGTSALARRIWKLRRTGMAFFTLGAAFLPISVWAAGYLNLLGDALSGADNLWLIALSFASFTVIAWIAVHLYGQIGWGIAALCGLTVTYLYTAAALTPKNDIGNAVLLIAVAVYALVLIFGSRILRQQQILPLPIGRVIEPFARIFTSLAFFVMFAALPNTGAAQLSSVAVFLTAFAFFAPTMTERFRHFTAIPTGILALIGFGQLLVPLYRTVFTTAGEWRDSHYPIAYFSLLCVLTAAIWLILLLTDSLPENTRKGYYTAALTLSCLSVPLQIPDVKQSLLIVPCAAAILMLLWVIHARKHPSRKVSWLTAAQSWALVLPIQYQIARTMPGEDSYRSLIFSGLFALCFVIFLLTKKHRTVISDLLFSVSAGVCTLNALDFSEVPMPAKWLCGIILAGLVLLYWCMALRHDTVKPEQYIYAALSPLTLFLATVFLSEDGLSRSHSGTMCIWSILSIGIGFATYFTTKRRFHSVRRVLFILTVIPPLILAVFAEALSAGKWVILQQIICAAAAVGLWLLFAYRGIRKPEIASFGAALMLLLEATVYAVRDFIYEGSMNFNVWMIASVWILLLSLISVIIAKRILLFVGNAAIPAVMQAVTPAAALLLSCMLLPMNITEWHSFYFVYTFGMCVAAWLVTKKEQIILPAVSGTALIFTLEALRRHCIWVGDGFVALMLLCFAGLTLLFPYLGIVAREYDAEPSAQRRAWVLTGMGGAVPFWLIAAAAYGTANSVYSYSHEQTKWMIFFVPVLLAGYILHFAKLVKTESNRRAVITVAAALGVIAFWMQPFFDVSDTYLEGKLHILPMVAFGIVIRKLYGEKIGGGFLFGVGIYTMLRLGFGAMATELPSDLITLLAAALVMFVASFYIKQKKWFLLGGISLVVTAVYMHMKLTDGTQWWVYLLLTGLILIIVAASNEMLKQRGDSLKNRAGRLWEDWSW